MKHLFKIRQFLFMKPNHEKNPSEIKLEQNLYGLNYFNCSYNKNKEINRAYEKRLIFLKYEAHSPNANKYNTKHPNPKAAKASNTKK